MSEVEILLEVQNDGSLKTLPDFVGVDIRAEYGDTIRQRLSVIGKRAIRNSKMNACAHKYCSIVAETLNSHGFEHAVTMQRLDGTDAELKTPWTMTLVKEGIFKPTLKAHTGQEKTSKATNAELCKVEETLGKFFAESLGLVIEWPSNQPPIWRSDND